MAYPEKGRSGTVRSSLGPPPGSRQSTLRNMPDLQNVVPPGFTPFPVPSAPGGLQSGISLGLGAIGGAFAGDPSHVNYVMGVIKGRQDAQQEALRANVALQNQAKIAAWQENRKREMKQFEVDAGIRQSEVGRKVGEEHDVAMAELGHKHRMAEIGARDAAKDKPPADEAIIDGWDVFAHGTRKELLALEDPNTMDLGGGRYALREPEAMGGEFRGTFDLNAKRLDLEQAYLEARRDATDVKTLRYIDEQYKALDEALKKYEAPAKAAPVREKIAATLYTAPAAGEGEVSSKAQMAQAKAKAAATSQADLIMDTIEQNRQLKLSLSAKYDELMATAERIEEDGADRDDAGRGRGLGGLWGAPAMLLSRVLGARTRALQTKGVQYTQPLIKTGTFKLEKIDPGMPPARVAAAYRNLAEQLLNEIVRLDGEVQKEAAKIPDEALRKEATALGMIGL